MVFRALLQLVLANILALVQSQASRADFTKSGQPGENYVKDLSDFYNSGSIGAYKSFLNIDSNKKIFSVDNGPLLSILAAPETLDDCLMVRHLTNVDLLGGACMLTSATDMDTQNVYLRPFSVGYDSFSVPTTSLYVSPNQLTTLTLPVNVTRMTLVPGDFEATFFLIGSYFNTTTTMTSIWIAKFTVNVTIITQKWPPTKGTFKEYTFAGKFTVTNATCITSRENDKTLAIFNPINTSLPLTGPNAQPSNNQILFIATPDMGGFPSKEASLVSFSYMDGVAKIPTYIMDLQWTNVTLLATVIEIVSNSPIMSLVDVNVAFNGYSDATFGLGMLTRTTISSSSPASELEYHHFVSVSDKFAAQRPVVLLVSHLYSSASSMENQKIIYRAIYIADDPLTLPVDRPPTGLSPNSNVSTTFMRPPERTEIRVRKTGLSSTIFNIRHFVNGELHWVDLFSAYILKVTSNKDYSNPSGMRMWRGSVLGRVWSAFAYIQGRKGWAATSASKPEGESIGLITINRGILLTNELGNKPFYAIYNLPESAGKYSSTYSLYQQNPDSASGNFQGKIIQKHTFDVANDWFGKIEGKSDYPLSAYPKRYNNVPLDLLQFKNAANISFEFINVPSNLQIINDKMHMVNFQKSGVLEADEVYFTAAGGVYIDHNRKVGFMKCISRGDYAAGLYNFTCSKVSEVDLKDNTITRVRDQNADCSSVLILTEHRTEDQRTFLVYNDVNRAIQIVGTYSKSSSADVYCVAGVYMMLSYDPENRTNSKLYKYDEKYQAFGNVSNQTLDLPSQLQSMQHGSFLTIKKPNLPTTMFLIGLIRTANTKMNIAGIKVAQYNETTKSFNLEKSMEYRSLPTLTQYTKICPQDTGYLVYDVIESNTILRIYPGEYYADSKQYHASYVVNLSILNLTRVKKIFCHDLDSWNAFSIYGESEITTGAITRNHTIIATYHLIQDNPASRLYNIYNSSALADSIFATDDGDAMIFFNMKSKILRVWFSKQPLKFYLGEVNTSMQDPNPKIVVNFFIKNNYDKMPATFTINLQIGTYINYTKRLDQLDYKQNANMTLIPDIVQSLTGPVLKIQLRSPTNLQVINNRTYLAATHQILKDGGVPIGTSSDAHTETTFGYEIIYTRGDRKFHIFNQEGFIVSCQLPGSFETNYRRCDII